MFLSNQNLLSCCITTPLRISIYLMAQNLQANQPGVSEWNHLYFTCFCVSIFWGRGRKFWTFCVFCLIQSCLVWITCAKSKVKWLLAKPSPILKLQQDAQNKKKNNKKYLTLLLLLLKHCYIYALVLFVVVLELLRRVGGEVVRNQLHCLPLVSSSWTTHR